MSTDLYYTAPAQEVFDDIKTAAIKIWQTYDNQFGYVDEKLRIIEPLENVSDNWMVMVSMFDSINQAKLMSMIHPSTAAQIVNAMA